MQDRAFKSHPNRAGEITKDQLNRLS